MTNTTAVLFNVYYSALFLSAVAFIFYIGKIIYDDRAIMFSSKNGAYLQFFFQHRRKKVLGIVVLFMVYFALFLLGLYLSSLPK
jgi:hypothetical protein